jgi:hypothetical protein
MKMETLMKRIIAVFALFAAATIGPVTHASAQVEAVRATVPFAFTVGNRLLPVGTYRITPWRTGSGTNRVLIQSNGQGVSQFAIAQPNHALAGGNAKLVFDKVGNQYFLKTIVSTSVTLALPKSDSEKKAQMLRGAVNNDTETVVP